MNHLAINICLLTAGFFGGIFAAPHRSGEPALAAPPDYYLGTEFTYVKAIDGDTLDITDPRGNITRIRLHAIDTPERGRPYFAQASQALEKPCKDTDIRLTQIGDGRHGRVSAYVYCGGKNANAALIESGAAIISIRYANAPYLYKLQEKTRQLCKGIWRRALLDNYPAKRLSGQSLIKGSVNFTDNKDCFQ